MVVIMTDITNKLGKRIQELRKSKGFTQSQLAELISVEVVTISRFENGIRFPKKENLERIAQVLNVEIKDLFDFGHHKTKTDLKKDIQNLLKNASLEDLQYVHRMLHFYFESK